MNKKTICLILAALCFAAAAFPSFISIAFLALVPVGLLLLTLSFLL